MSDDNNVVLTSTIGLIAENDKYDKNKDKKENGNIDINRNYEEEPVKSKKRNIDINAEPYNGLEKEQNLGNTYTSNEIKILNIMNDINNKIKEFQVIPLYIQKGNEKKFLLVKKNMTLREIIFINFKDNDAENYTFYNGVKRIDINEKIEKLNIAPLSHITNYPETDN